MTVMKRMMRMSNLGRIIMSMTNLKFTTHTAAPKS